MNERTISPPLLADRARDGDEEPENAGEADQHLLLSIMEAARCLGIPRTLLYEIVGRGELTTVRLGRRRMIRRRDLETFVAALSAV